MDFQNNGEWFDKCDGNREVKAKRLNHFQTGIFAELDEKKENLIKQGCFVRRVMLLEVWGKAM